MSLARILIVEDEIIAAQGLRHTLTHLGYDALAIATSGREAIDRVGELQPDLVLMDVRLKGDLDGIEAAERIRSRFDIPIIYLTAHADDETLNRAKQTEPSGYLLKPLSTDVLRSTLEMALYKHRAETRLRESEETLKRRATQLALLNDVGNQIAATLETDEIMGKAVHLIHETFDYHHVALFILDGKRDEMVMRARAGDFGHLFPPEHRVSLDQGLVGWTARQGQTAVANDVTADPRYVNFYPDLIPSRAELCAPIWVADSVVGVLDVQSPQRDAFDENDARVMETLTTQVAVALQNARLHDQVQQELAERRRAQEALRESAKNLALAQEIAHIGSWGYNVEREELYWSDELFKIYGLDPEETEVSLEYGIGMIHPDDKDSAAETFQRAMQDGVPYDIDYRIIRPDGRERCVRGIGRIETADKGHVLQIYGTGQDITEQKRAEQALRESRDGMVMAQEIANLGNWNWDVATGTVHWSDQFYRILGLEPGQVEPSAELYWQVIHPDDLPHEREASRIALSSPGNIYDVEHRIVRPDGTERVVRSQGKVTAWSEDKQPLYMIGTTQDITDRKQAEEALHRSLQETAHSQRLLIALSQAAQAVQRARDPEAVYRALGEQTSKLDLNATIFTLSEDRTHLLLSHLTFRPGLVQAAETLTGLSAEGYRFPLAPGGFFQRIIDAGETVFSRLDAAPFVEALPPSLHPLAGQVADLCDWQQSIIAPLSIGSEVEGLLVVTGTGLTESDVPAITAFANQTAIAVENARLYKATQQLAASNESIVQSMAEGIIMADADGLITFVNPATADLLGYAPHQLVGSHWTAFVPPDQHPIIQAADERRLRGEADRYEVEMARQDGQRISVLVSGTPRFDADGQFAGTLAVFTDITERKRAEKERECLNLDLETRLDELRETQSQLIQSAKLAAVGELAAGVAHELNNPLTSIMGFSNLLLLDVAPDDAMREDLETIFSEANRARTIVRNLLTFARQVESHPEQTDLNQVIQETLALVRRHIESDGIEIVEQYAPDLPTLRLDVGRMKQVFLNLINNAHQAMAQGDRLFITSRQEGEELAIQLQDTGRGIPEEHLAQIFEPFFTTKLVGQGTGLGLSVSMGIVHDHAGRIEVESQVGQGSTFTVWLPIETKT